MAARTAAVCPETITPGAIAAPSAASPAGNNSPPPAPRRSPPLLTGQRNTSGRASGVPTRLRRAKYPLPKLRSCFFSAEKKVSFKKLERHQGLLAVGLARVFGGLAGIGNGG